MDRQADNQSTVETEKDRIAPQPHGLLLKLLINEKPIVIMNNTQFNTNCTTFLKAIPDFYSRRPNFQHITLTNLSRILYILQPRPQTT